MYRAVLEGEVYEVSSPAVAEMEKILENTYRNINIGLVNELTMLCNEMGISMWEVVDNDKPNPPRLPAIYPGPGLGQTLHWPRWTHTTSPGKPESTASIPR